MLTPEQLAEMRVRCNDGYVMIYDEIEQLLDHIDQLQRELDEQCRLHGIGANREAKLIAERDALKSANESKQSALEQIRYQFDRCRTFLLGRGFKCEPPDLHEAVITAIGQALDERDALQRQLDALKRLVQFARHEANCDSIGRSGRSLRNVACSCGYEQARKLIEKEGGAPDPNDAMHGPAAT